MKKYVVFFLLSMLYMLEMQGQSGTIAKAPAAYSQFMHLQAGEKAVAFYSCMWLDEKNMFRRLVIQHEGNKYSVVTPLGRKDDLSPEQMHQITSSSYCGDYDPGRPIKETRYTGSKLVKTGAGGKKSIVSGGKSYGPFDEILFIQESGEKFIAVGKSVKNGKAEILYVDGTGRKKVLNAAPLQVIVNNDLSRAAVIMPPAEAIPAETVNTWPREKQYAYYDEMAKMKNVVWFNNDSSTTIARKYRRLEYDVSGRHFVVVYIDHFFIDGVKINKNISGAGTRLFVGKDANSWVYWYQIYLGCSDGSSFKDVINPFFSSVDGKDYLNWFVVESNKDGDVIKWGKKEL